MTEKGVSRSDARSRAGVAHVRARLPPHIRTAAPPLGSQVLRRPGSLRWLALMPRSTRCSASRDAGWGGQGGLERMGRMDACSNEVAGGAGGEVHHRLRAARMRKWKRSRVCNFGKGMWTSVNFCVRMSPVVACALRLGRGRS